MEKGWLWMDSIDIKVQRASGMGRSSPHCSFKNNGLSRRFMFLTDGCMVVRSNLGWLLSKTLWQTLLGGVQWVDWSESWWCWRVRWWPLCCWETAAWESEVPRAPCKNGKAATLWGWRKPSEVNKGQEELEWPNCLYESTGWNTFCWMKGKYASLKTLQPRSQTTPPIATNQSKPLKYLQIFWSSSLEKIPTPDRGAKQC